METVSCVICGNADSSMLSDTGRWGLPLSTVVCRHCGLVYSSPRLDQKEYDLFNTYFYRIFYQGHSAPNLDYVRDQGLRAKKVDRYLLDNNIDISAMDSVLDVGCSAGGMLNYFKSKGLSICDGIEPNPEYAKYGNETFGVNIQVGNVESFQSNTHYDLIIMRDVLEHFRFPNQALVKIRQLCKPSTVIFIETNNVFRPLFPWDHYRENFQYVHPFTFSITSLTNILRQTGFDIGCVENNRYLKCIAKPIEADPDYLKCEDYQSIESYIAHHNKTLPFKKLDFFLRSNFYQIRKKLGMLS